jgi:NAD(P)H-hydrate repair Nnr-like enzyme with NAD(P)H-hydrate dehydratase domain
MNCNDGIVGLGDDPDRPRKKLGASPGVVGHADQYPGALVLTSIAAALLNGAHVHTPFSSPTTILGSTTTRVLVAPLVGAAIDGDEDDDDGHDNDRDL